MRVRARVGGQSFNPHRSRRTGATGPQFRLKFEVIVSILTGPEGPVQPMRELMWTFACGVSILTGPEGPVQLGGRLGAPPTQGVSILTGPEGPVQPYSQPSASPRKNLFQSSPVPKDRCNMAMSTTTSGLCSFQSSPVPKDRCNHPGPGGARQGRGVSILTGPEGPVQPASRPSLRRSQEVSILTGPEGPVQLDELANNIVGDKFQSSPVPKDRCNPREPRAGAVGARGFNPHRSRRTGATGPGEILSGLPRGFNPHRSRRTGATSEGRGPLFRKVFQSSPVPKDRCNPRTVPEYAAQFEFQSSPVPKDRCNRLRGQRPLIRQGVSILTGPEGPVQLHARTRARWRSKFQSSPVPKDRCNSDEAGREAMAVDVSILTGPEGPVQRPQGP